MSPNSFVKEDIKVKPKQHQDQSINQEPFKLQSRQSPNQSPKQSLTEVEPKHDQMEDISRSSTPIMSMDPTSHSSKDEASQIKSNSKIKY